MKQKVSGLLHSQIVLVIVISHLVVLLSREGGKWEGVVWWAHCGADMLFFSLQASKAAVWASLQIRGKAKASSLLMSSTAKTSTLSCAFNLAQPQVGGRHLYMFTVCSEAWGAQTQCADSPHFCCTSPNVTLCIHTWLHRSLGTCVCICAFMCLHHALDALISRTLRSAEANVLMSCCCCCLILTHQT